MRGAVRVLVGQHADEAAVLVEIIQREVDQPLHRLARRQRGEIEFALQRTDLGIGRLQRGAVEIVLAAEIIVDELLVGLGAAGDLVDARAFQPLRRELDARGRQDRGARGFRVAPVPALRFGKDLGRKRHSGFLFQGRPRRQSAQVADGPRRASRSVRQVDERLHRRRARIVQACEHVENGAEIRGSLAGAALVVVVEVDMGDGAARHPALQKRRNVFAIAGRCVAVDHRGERGGADLLDDGQRLVHSVDERGVGARQRLDHVGDTGLRGRLRHCREIVAGAVPALGLVAGLKLPLQGRAVNEIGSAEFLAERHERPTRLGGAVRHGRIAAGDRQACGRGHQPVQAADAVPSPSVIARSSAMRLAEMRCGSSASVKGATSSPSYPVSRAKRHCAAKSSSRTTSLQRKISISLRPSATCLVSGQPMPSNLCRRNRHYAGFLATLPVWHLAGSFALARRSKREG